MVYYTYTVTRGGGRPTGAARWHAGSLTRTLSRTSAFARTLATLRGQREVAPRVPTTISSDPTADALPSHTFPRALYTHVSSLPPGSLISPQAPPLHRPPTHSLHASRSPRSIRSTALSLSFSLSISHEAAAARRLRAILARRTPHAARLTPRLIAARRTAARPPNIHLPSSPTACRPSAAVRRLPPVARHPLPATRLEGSSPRRAEQHGSSLSCDGTCSTPSTIARYVEPTRLDSGHAAVGCIAPRRVGSHRATPPERPRRLRDHAAPCWLVPCQHRQRAITSPTSLSLSLSTHPTATFLRQLVVISYATVLSSSISSHTHTTCCRCRYHRRLFVCTVTTKLERMSERLNRNI